MDAKERMSLWVRWVVMFMSVSSGSSVVVAADNIGVGVDDVGAHDVVVEWCC